MSDNTLAVPARAEIPRGWFDTLTAYLPEAYRAQAVVAGGFAVSPSLAGDIDLWIPGGDNYAIAYCDIKNHLMVAGHIPSPTGILEFLKEEEVYPDGRHLVATIKNVLLGKDMQILVAKTANPQALVDSFDLSVHALGISKRDHEFFHVHFGKDWTPATEPIRVLRFTTPESTFDRVMKLKDRYNVPVDPVGYLKLQAELDKRRPAEPLHDTREEAAA